MLKTNGKSYWPTILRWVVGIFLIVSAWAKLQAPINFFVFLGKLNIQTALNEFILYGMTSLELFWGVLCLLGILPRLTLRAVSALFISFGFVIAFAFMRNITGSCGCFGNIWRSEVGIWAIIRNFAVAVMAFYLSNVKTDLWSLNGCIERFLK
jgi:uncharacterized membrane protein YphA (DoxX/SURF4 family)